MCAAPQLHSAGVSLPTRVKTHPLAESGAVTELCARRKWERRCPATDRRRVNRVQHSFRPGSTTHPPRHLALELHTNLTDKTQNNVSKHSRPTWQLASLASRPGPRNHPSLACLTVSCTSVSTNSPRPWRAGAARLVLATWPLLPLQWHLPACKSATQQELRPRR